MHAELISLEIAVVILGLALLLIDLWTPTHWKRSLGYFGAAGLAFILLGSFLFSSGTIQFAFDGMYWTSPFSKAIGISSSVGIQVHETDHKLTRPCCATILEGE